MRIIKKYLLALSVVALFGSCDDNIINTEERDALAENQILNIGGLEATMFQVYERTRSIHEDADISIYKICGDDLSIQGTNMPDSPIGGIQGMNSYASGFSPSSINVYNIWNSMYNSLANCNRVIANTIVPKDATETAKISRFVGEAHAMRAYLYLELVERFENIPLAKLLPAGQEPQREAPLEDKSVIYKQIIDDCNAAIPLLQARGGTTGVTAPSKGLAYHILSLAYMDLGKWAEAAVAAENVISQGGYTLQPLDKIFALSADKVAENNNELIFSFGFDKSVVNRKNRMIMMMVPLYDRVNGVARDLNSGGRPYARLSPNDYYFSLFESTDLRVNAWHKLTWKFDVDISGDAIVPGSGFKIGDVVTPAYVALSGASIEPNKGARIIERACTKLWEDGTYGRLRDDAEGFRNVIVYRLAQAYLIAAEAHWRNGNSSRALQLINKIRERAFGNTSRNYTALTQDIILDENARELGFEGHRWALLKRMGLLVERVKAHNAVASTNILPKHVSWPLPQSFVDLAKVKQNTGWDN
ncbi:Starch-binding associating with outer membrane [Flavobacterium fluvii]|uniref:Starch-binding associating with outer membrane n=1 Tax=Flavobacterium fluvii TaxID=468056 RepID=A0A1M5FVX5_9FLAO|nr:RagB/SusD family nutrient uptake outer membrane protein [Flavobacterium fluvii]SHF95352.1 Starch-binding associating with outer membrane [Flavobacterium fluvii]